MNTTYKTAANWLNPSLILCNEIAQIDESIYDNCRFSLYDEETEEETEIFQFFLTSLSESDVEFLEEHFHLLFTYSDKLELFVLCVDFWGTSWDSVPCWTDLEQAANK